MALLPIMKRAGHSVRQVLYGRRSSTSRAVRDFFVCLQHAKDIKWVVSKIYEIYESNLIFKLKQMTELFIWWFHIFIFSWAWSHEFKMVVKSRIQIVLFLSDYI